MSNYCQALKPRADQQDDGDTESMMTRALICLMFAALHSPGTAAEAVLVAVASNFAKPMQDIADRFTAQSGEAVRLSFGSSGKFYAQIKNGAPYDLFLSADQDKTERLVSEGLAVSSSRMTYAVGRLVVWSRLPDPRQRLTSLEFGKLSLANPRLAPYGAAAVDVLQHLGIVQESQPRWITGENIAQTFLFAASGNADIGFVAASQVMLDGNVTQGYGWLVPPELHKPIRQDAVLLKRSTSSAAQQLLIYLASPEAQGVTARYGYGMTNAKP